MNTRASLHSFPVSSEDCQILLLLEESRSVAAVASALRRDVSVVSRHVARLAQDGAFVEKVDGRWGVSARGRRVAAWARDAIQSQGQALSACGTIRIATTREFAARVLGPAFVELRARMARLSTGRITILTSEEGVESRILAGEADIGLDCGRLSDPTIRFRRVVAEPFVLAAAPAFLKSLKKSPSIDLLLDRPHLQYQRINTARLLGLSIEIPKTVGVFNDLGAVRAACESGAGWAVFPKYAVAHELEQGTLQELGAFSKRMEPEQFGVWWLRDRRTVEPTVAELVRWLASVKLG